MKLSLAESPSGLWHLINVLSNGHSVTLCGRDVNQDTWTRHSDLDYMLGGRTTRSILSMLDTAVYCERCFPGGRA